MDRIANFLSVGDAAGYNTWLQEAKAWAGPAMRKMLVNPGKDASGLLGEVKADVERAFHLEGKPLEGWQQFAVRARDEHGVAVTDYMIEVFEQVNGEWARCEEMSLDVHAYGADASYRCLHVRLPQGISNSQVPMQIRIQASTGTEIMMYQGYGSDDSMKAMRAGEEAVIVDITGGLEGGSASLFHPFTTTMVEIILNRVPYPFGQISEVFTWVMDMEAAAVGG